MCHRDLSTSSITEPFMSMCQDPLDRRQLCVSGGSSSHGGAPAQQQSYHHLAVVMLTDVKKDDVCVKHYRLASRTGAGGMCVCVCVCTCVCACLCVCVRVCTRVCVCVLCYQP